MNASSRMRTRCASRSRPIAAARSGCSRNSPYERERFERSERSERLMLRLYNTLTRREEEFAPSQDKLVRMYACGPTVYARAHIGNFRTFVCVDVLRRTLKYLGGYTVREAVNYTDVDDNTITGAQQAGVPLRDYTEEWIRAFRSDSEQLGLEPPEETPRATDEANMRAMGELIAALNRNGHTYVRGGSTYFKISTLPDYGKLARLDHEGMKSGVSVDV